MLGSGIEIGNMGRGSVLIQMGQNTKVTSSLITLTVTGGTLGLMKEKMTNQILMKAIGKMEKWMEEVNSSTQMTKS